MSRFAGIAFGLLLAAPLVALPGTGPDALRIPYVGVLVTLLAVCSAGRSTKKAGHGLWGDPVLLALGTLIAISAISILAAHDPWSGVGPLSILLLGCGAYLSVRTEVLSRENLSRWGWPLVAVVGMLLGGIMCVQFLRELPPVGTLGNTNLAGATTAIAFPFVLALAVRSRRRLLFVSSAIVLLAATLLTEARGALVGLAVGSLVVIGGTVRRRWLLALVAVVAFCAAGAIAALLVRRPDSVRVRWGLWKGSWELFQERPILGCGLGNFPVAFPPYREEKEFRISNERAGEKYVEAESAHSLWVQTASESGALGLLGLLLVVAVAVRVGRASFHSAADPRRRGEILGAGGGTAAFLAAGMSNSLLGEAAPTLLFFLFLAVLSDPRPAGGLPLITSGAAILVGGLIVLFGIHRAMADRAFLRATAEPDARRRMEHLRRSLDWNGRDWRAHFELGSVLGRVGRAGEAVTEFRRALDLRPNSVIVLNHLARWRGVSGGTLDESEGYLERAGRIAPFYYRSHYNRGLLRLQRRDWTGARSAFTTSIRCRADHVLSYLYRALASYRDGDEAGAAADARHALRLDAQEVERRRRQDRELDQVLHRLNY